MALTTSLIVAAAASAAYGTYEGEQARKKAAEAGDKSQVDINAIDAQTRDIATKNAYDSAALEKALTPEVPALRTAANQGVLAGLKDDQATATTKDYLMAHLGQTQEAQSPLLQAAIAKARSDLALGGKLPQDVANQVTRQSLSQAGTVAPGTLGLGRDLTARDLGLNSLQLEQQRLGTAGQLGQAELGANQFNTQFNASNILNQMNLLQQISNSGFNRNLLAAQYGESIKQPQVGMDPSAVANLNVANANARAAALANQANVYGQSSANYLKLAGSLAGMAGGSGGGGGGLASMFGGGGGGGSSSMPYGTPS